MINIYHIIYKLELLVYPNAFQIIMNLFCHKTVMGRLLHYNLKSVKCQLP